MERKFGNLVVAWEIETFCQMNRETGTCLTIPLGDGDEVRRGVKSEEVSEQNKSEQARS